MQNNYKSQFLVFTLLTISLLSACTKRKELDEIGCVKGKTNFSSQFYPIGAMSKKEFLNYLDSPSYKVNSDLIDYEMRWEKTENAELCPTGI